MSDDTNRNASDRELDDVSGGMSSHPAPNPGPPGPPTHPPGAGRVHVDPPFPPGRGKAEPD